MNSVNFIIKIINDASLIPDSSLESEIKKRYIPRLWENKLVDRSSFEGQFTEVMRKWSAFPSEKKCWKQIFRAIFADSSTQLAIEELPQPQRSAFYSLKARYVKKELFSDGRLSLCDQLKKSPLLAFSGTRLHWVEDPASLHKISLLRNITDADAPECDADILQELWNSDGASPYDEPRLLEKVSSYLIHLLEMDAKDQTRAIDASVGELLKKGQDLEQRFQHIIKRGKQQNLIEEANEELKRLAALEAASIQNLTPGECWLLFGGVPQKPPNLNLDALEKNPAYDLLNNFLEQERLPESLYAFIDAIFDELNQLKREHGGLEEEYLSRLLKEGVTGLLFADVDLSVDPNESFFEQLSNAPQKLLYRVAKEQLTSIENSALEKLGNEVSNLIGPEFFQEMRTALIAGSLTEEARTRLKDELESTFQSTRKSLIKSLIQLGSLFPDEAATFIAAMGYGNLGSVEEPIWFEVSRHEDGTYGLAIFASGKAAKQQRAVPLKYTSLTDKELDADFIFRLLTYRAWPAWYYSQYFELKELHEMLLRKFGAVPLEPQTPAENFCKAASKNSGIWGILKPFIGSHARFTTQKERDQFFFNVKKCSLIGYWKKIHADGLDPNRSKMALASSTAEALMEESIAAFENDLITLDDYKAIYATIWEIQEEAKPYIKPLTITRKKGKIVPIELASMVERYLSKNGIDGLKTLKNLLSGILGAKAEEAIDTLFEDFLQVPAISDPAEEPLNGWQFARKIINITLDSTLGFNLEDILAPTTYSYIKLAISTCRLALTLIFPAFSLSLNVTWFVYHVAKATFLQITLTYFPESYQNLVRWDREFQDWQEQTFTRVLAEILLTEDQKKDFEGLLSNLQRHLNHTGTLDFNFPPIQKELPSLKLNKIQIKVLSPKIVERTIRSEVSPVVFDEITAANCSDTLDHIVRAIETVNYTADEMALWLNSRISLFPMPLQGKKNDVWSDEENIYDCLENLTYIALAVYANISQESSSHFPTEVLHLATIHLYKIYAIIDKLARRCPETMLTGFQVNPWALALLKDNIYFQRIDPVAQSELEGVCAYFGIDYHKRYTEEEINSLGENSLFFDVPQDATDRIIVNRHKMTGEKLWMGKADSAHYRKLLEQNEMDSKYIFSREEVWGEPELIDRISWLVRDPSYKSLDHAGSEARREMILQLMSENGKNPRYSPLPRAFYLLRRVNLMANEYARWICHPRFQIAQIDSKNSPLTSKLDEDSEVRKTINAMSFGHYGKKNDPSSSLGNIHRYIHLRQLGANNSAEKMQMQPKKIPTFHGIRVWSSDSQEDLGMAEDCFIMQNLLHRIPRTQNAILNNPKIYTRKIMCKEMHYDTLLGALGAAILPNIKEDKVSKENLFSKMSEKERAVFEMIWVDEKDHAVRVISYFTQQQHHLQNIDFLRVFKLMLFRGSVLDDQLKAYPYFARTLGQFFVEAIALYGELIPITQVDFYTDEKDADIQAFLQLIELGIFAYVKARTVDPQASSYFPDFIEILIKLDDPKSERSISNQISKCLLLQHYFIDPRKATEDELSNAIFCIVYANMKKGDYQGHIAHHTLIKWASEVNRILESNTVVRNRVFNRLAQSLNQLKPGEERIWHKTLYQYVGGDLIFINISLNAEFSLAAKRPKAIDSALNRIFRTAFFIRTKRSESSYTTIDFEPEISFTPKPTDAAGAIHYTCTARHKNKEYRWVNQEDSLDEEYTYWLETKCTSGKPQLLVMAKGKIVEVQVLSADEANKTSYHCLGNIGHFKDPRGEPIDLSKEKHGLNLLSWFQPLSSIAAFRSYDPPYDFCLLEFKQLRLSFSISKIDGKSKAMGKGKIDGFSICENQQDLQIPALKHHARYLILENTLGQNKVILPTDDLYTSLVSWLIRATSGITTSRYIDQQLSQASEDLFSLNFFKTQSLYHVYDVDEKGLFSSDDPEAYLHLILYSLAQGQLAEITHYFAEFTRLCRLQRLPSRVLRLVQKVEMTAMIIRDPLTTRLALLLAALREENILVPVEEVKSESRYFKVNSHDFVSYLAMQMNYLHFQKHQNELPTLPLDEYQELYILHSISRIASGLFKKTLMKEEASNAISTYIKKIGKKTIIEAFMMLPGLARRYTYLKTKYRVNLGNTGIQASDFIQNFLHEEFLSSDKGEGAAQKQEEEKLEAGFEESDLQKLCYLISPKAQCTLNQILNDRPKFFLKKWNDAWRTVPTHFTELTRSNLCTHFYTYYQLAIGKPPKKYKDDSIDRLAFYAKVEEFKNALKLAHGHCIGSSILIDTLRIALEDNFISNFPCTERFEDDFTHYDKIKNKGFSPSFMRNYFANRLIEEIEESRKRMNIVSYTPIQSILALIKSNLKQAGMKIGAFSLAAAWNMTPIPLMIEGAFWAYRSVRAMNYLKKQYEKIKAEKALAQIEREKIDARNEMPEVPLPQGSLEKLQCEDVVFYFELKNLVKTHFTKVTFPVDDAGAHKPIPVFKTTSTNPKVNQLFKNQNQSQIDYVNRDAEKIFPYELKGIEHYFLFLEELKSAQKVLSKSIESFKNLLMRSRDNRVEASLSDSDAISAAIEKRNAPADILREHETIDTQFQTLLLAFILNEEEALLRHLNFEANKLPELKALFYRYLLEITRLQSIERALHLLEGLNFSTDDAVNTLQLQKAVKELLTKRVYHLVDIPIRLLRGYLAFEYGTDTKLRTKQVSQFQAMLLSEYSKILLELIMGSGKTFFGTSIIDFFVSNLKQLVYNCYVESLVKENTHDTSARNLKVFNQQAKSISISRNTFINEDRLWGLFLSLQASIDQSGYFNGSKRDLQSLDLMYVEAVFNPNTSDEIIDLYKQILIFFRTKVKGNIDETHRLLKANDVLNHPEGDMVKIRPSYVNIISEVMRQLVCNPEIAQMIPLQKNEQALCSLEKYTKIVMPFLAKKMSKFPLFEITEADRELFVEYLCGNTKEVPLFVLQHPRRSDIGMARGVIYTILPFMLQQQVNKNYGIKDNPDQFARPYSSKDTPEEGSTFQNPHVAAVKTFATFLYIALDESQVLDLIVKLKTLVQAKHNQKYTPIEKSREARLFFSWMGEKYRLSDFSIEDLQNRKLPPHVVKELISLCNQSYAAKLSYVRLFPLPEIDFFPLSYSSDSHNFASIFSSFCGGSASPNPDDTPLGTINISDPGTRGEHFAFVKDTWTDESCVDISSREPRTALNSILESCFSQPATHGAVIDSGALFQGLTNSDCAAIILEFIKTKRPDLQAVVYFNEQKRLVVQKPGGEPQPLESSKIRPDKRISSFAHSEIVGTNISQGKDAIGVQTIDEKLTFEDWMQAGGRMRGLRTDGQRLIHAAHSSVRELITENDKFDPEELAAFLLTNEGIALSVEPMQNPNKQAFNVVRSMVRDKSLFAPTVAMTRQILFKFDTRFRTPIDDDAFETYGYPEVEYEKDEALQLLRKDQYKCLKGSGIFSKEELARAKIELRKVGENCILPDKIRLVKKGDRVYFGTANLGGAQFVSQSARANQQQQQEQQAEQNQNQNQNQNMFAQIGHNRNLKLREAAALWDGKRDYFSNVGWLNEMSQENETTFNAQKVQFYPVEASFQSAAWSAYGEVAKAFGDLFWTNNLRGICEDKDSIIMTDDDSIAPLFYTLQKNIQELLVVELLYEGTPHFFSLAIDQKEARFWRDQLAANKKPRVRTKGAARKKTEAKIGLFDVATGTLVDCGKTPIDLAKLLSNQDFLFDIARWRFLAGQVKLSDLNNSALHKRLEDWVKLYDREKLENIFKAIHKIHGISEYQGSDMQTLLCPCDKEVVEELV